MKIQGVGLIDFKKQNHKTNNVRFNFCAKNKFDSFERTTKTPTITTALKMQGEAMAKEGKAVYKKACKVQKDVQKSGINAQITGRAKHYYSIYAKMKRQNIEFSDLYDITAVRVIVDTERN